MNYTGERPDVGDPGSLLRYHSILHLCKNKSCLDFGCGIGIGTKYLSDHGVIVVGYDICSEALDEARTLSNNLFVNSIQYVHPELLILNEVIEHMETSELEELLRFFKCDIVGTTPDGQTFPYAPKTLAERRGFHVLHYTYSQLLALFSKYYKYVEIYGAIYDPILEKYTSLNFVCQERQ